MAMMNCRRLFFVFLVSIFIKFVFSTPSSSEEFADECDKIEKEIVRIPKVKQRLELVERLAKARLELVAKDKQVKEELAAKDKQVKEELAAKDREIGGVILEKEQAKEIQITFVPRALQDRIIDRYLGDYKAEMEEIRKNISATRSELTVLPKKIKHLENLRSNKTLDLEEIKKNITILMGNISRLSSAITVLEKELPPPDLVKEYSRENKIRKDAHLFYWIIMKKEKSDEEVGRVCMYLERWYQRKPEKYRQCHTFDQYRRLCSTAMGEIRQQMNEASAHVLVRIPLEEGFEFRNIPIFGKPELDEFTTILINAVGLQSISAAEAGKRNRSISSGTILKNAVTQESLLRTYTEKMYV